MRRSKNEGDLSKLPKWAQRRIEKLEGDCEYYQGKMQEMSGAEGSSEDGPPIIARPYDDNPLRIPRGSKVIFQLEEGDDYIDVPSMECRVSRIRKGGPWVFVLRTTNGTLLVQPEGSNSIMVRQSKYGKF